jgi:hypothetical protein
MCVSADEAEGGGDVGGSDFEKVDSWAVFPLYMAVRLSQLNKTVHKPDIPIVSTKDVHPYMQRWPSLLRQVTVTETKKVHGLHRYRYRYIKKL